MTAVESVSKLLDEAFDRIADQPAPAGPRWRNRRIAATLTRCRERRGLKKLDNLLANRYGAVMLKELSDQQLDEVFRTVASW